MKQSDITEIQGIFETIHTLTTEAEEIIARQPIEPDSIPPEPGEVVAVGTAEELRAALADPAAEIIELGADIEGNFNITRGLTLRGDTTVPAGRIATDADVPTLRGLLTIKPGADGVLLERFRVALGTQYDTLISFEPGSYRGIMRQMIGDGEDNGRVKRGVRADCTDFICEQSAIWGIWKDGQDSQAICAWNAPGPYRIVDNYLEAASENIMFGGADPNPPGIIPEDILIEGNDFEKRDAWRELAQTGINVKNLLELKCARRVVIRRNRFRGCWVDGQTGFAVLFKSANQGGKNPEAITCEVEFYENEVRDTIHGISFLGQNYNHVTQRGYGFLIRDNLFEMVECGRFINITGGTRDITIDHNTIIHREADGFSKNTRGKIMVEEGQPTVPAPPQEGFRYTNNLQFNGRRYGSTPDQANGYGFWAEEGGANGLSLGGALYPDAVFAGNVIAHLGTQKHGYPVESNRFVTEEEFYANLSGAPDYFLVGDPYPGLSTDGTPVGRRVPAKGEAT